MRILIVLLLITIRCFCFGQFKQDTIRVSKDIFLIKLSDHAFVHVSFSNFPTYGPVQSNGLIFMHKNKAFLFDTPMTDSLTEKLVFWLRDFTKTKVVGFIPNHWHNDCMGGLGFLQKLRIKSYANQLTIDIAKSKSLPVPEQGFEDSLKLQLNGKA